MIRRVAMLLLAAAPVATAQSGFNSRRDAYNVVVDHPPELVIGVGTGFAVARFTGRGSCGPDIQSRVSTAITQSGRFQLVEAPRLTGTSSATQTLARTMMSGSIVRCGADTSAIRHVESSKDRNGKPHFNNSRTTTAHLAVSVRFVDVATGRILLTRDIAFDRPDSVTVVDSLPHPTDGAAMLQQEVLEATDQIARIILPWQETLRVLVHADKECDLMPGAEYIRIGNYLAAADTMQKAIDRGCDAPGDRIALAKAYQDKGVALLLAGRPDDALPPLQQASALWPGDVSADAINAARMVIAAREEKKRQDALSAQQTTAARASAPRPPQTLSNQDIIDMVNAKLSDQLIIAKVNAAACTFDNTPKALIALKKAGVPDAVLFALNARQCGQ